MVVDLISPSNYRGGKKMTVHKILMKRTCSSKGCNEEGVAYVPENGREKPHYCTRCNPLVKKLGRSPEGPGGS